MLYLIIILTSFFHINGMTQEASRYKLIKMNIDESFKRCNAGGVLYKSNYYQAINLYLDFKKEFPHCTSEKTYASGKLKQSADHIRSLAESMAKDQTCPQLQKIAQTFLVKEKHTLDQIKNDKDAIGHLVKKDAKEYKLQVESALLAWSYYMCDAGFLGQNLQDRLKMLSEIKALNYKVPPVTVKTGNDIIESCNHVIANGPEITKRFGVDVSMAPKNELNINFTTYYIKDQLLVKDQNENILYDSGCIRANLPSNIRISISGKKIIYFDVKPNCEGDSGSDWHINMSCGQPKRENLTILQLKNEKYCQNKSYEMLTKLQENAELVFAAQHFRWLAANCYEDHYKKVASEYTNIIDPKSFFDLTSSEKTQIKNLEVKQNKISLKETQFKRKNKTKTYNPFVYDYKDFLNKKKRYCKEIPNEKMPIFERISRAYCHYAYPRLFAP